MFASDQCHCRDLKAMPVLRRCSDAVPGCTNDDSLRLIEGSTSTNDINEMMDGVEVLDGSWFSDHPELGWYPADRETTTFAGNSVHGQNRMGQN